MNILCLIPNQSDATSLYRGMGPIARLRDSMPEVSPMFLDKINWATLSMVDMIFMQRPYTSNHLQIAEMAQENRVPIWVDYDDDLFRVPSYNPTYEQYSDEDTMRNVAKIIQAASVVTVTTQHLKNNLITLNNNIRVVPNAIDTKTFVYREPIERRPHVLWRGSATHDKDMMLYTPAICEATRVNPNFSWTFIGKPFWWTIEQLPTKTTILAKALDPMKYMVFLQETAPAMVQVPLVDCDFNRSKSNIAWLEASFAGAITLGPDWEEWRKPGVITYTNHAQYLDALSHLVRGEIDIAAHAKNAWEYICDTVTLERVNEERKKIIMELCG